MSRRPARGSFASLACLSLVFVAAIRPGSAPARACAPERHPPGAGDRVRCGHRAIPPESRRHQIAQRRQGHHRLDPRHADRRHADARRARSDHRRNQAGVPILPRARSSTFGIPGRSTWRPTRSTACWVSIWSRSPSRAGGDRRWAPSPGGSTTCRWMRASASRRS